jgi:predicted nuclease of predicted toxin-antitoxin system
VKFLIDAQLPGRLAEFLIQAGHDAVHTSELPDGNRSADRQIAQRADSDGRIVITKDGDFRDGHLLARSPRQLLVVATGNITNDALLELFELHLDAVAAALDQADLVELSQDTLTLSRHSGNMGLQGE